MLINVERLQELRDRVSQLEALLNEKDDERIAAINERITAGEEPLKEWSQVKAELGLE